MRNRRRSAGVKLPIVPPRKATSRRPSRGRSVRCWWKSPTTACTGRSYSVRDVVGGVAQRLLADVEGDEPLERRRGRPWRPAAAGSSRRCPSPARRASSAMVRRAISSRALGEDRVLGPGRVVLGQAGDLVEELAAPLVVEPDGRQRLRHRGSGPSRTSAAMAAARSSVDQVDVDRDGRSCPAPDLEVPGQAQAGERPSGPGREEVPVGRPGCGPSGVTQAPPRRTCCPDMNLPLYSPTAPAAGRKPGYGRYADDGPLPHVAEQAEVARRADLGSERA